MCDKPEFCPICRSIALVPIVYGSPIPELYDAAVIGAVDLAGSDAIQVGDALWRCNNCLGFISRPVFKSHGDRLYEEYSREIQSILQNVPELSDNGRRFLNGENWAKIILRKYFGSLGLTQVHISSDASNTYCLGARLAGSYCYSEMEHFIRRSAPDGRVEVATNRLDQRIVARASLLKDSIVIERID